jgi:adenylate cyclase
MLYSWRGLPTLAVATVDRATGRPVRRSIFGQRVDGAPAAWIDFRGPPGTISEISYARVMRGQFKRGFFRGKIVVVGPVASALKDQVHTAVGGNALMSGAEVDANAIDTILHGNPLRDVPTWLNLLLIGVLGIVVPAAGLRFGPLVSFFLAIAAGVLFAIAAQFAFDSGIVVSVLYPLVALIVGTVASLIVHYFTETRERQRTRLIFSRFVPEGVVDEVLASTDSDLRLGAVQRDGTVMFCDVRGFTTFAESLPVGRVLDVLNQYLDQMSEAILNHGGTLVTYMGDGIMAVFGAPIEQANHADRAVAAAREMLGPRLRQVNDYVGTTSSGWAFELGIGINSGEVMSGNVGSSRRLEYTAIGDTTNTAARLETMTKGTPYQIFIAESTRRRLSSEPSDLEYVGEFDVRGRQERIKLWSLGERAVSTANATRGTLAGDVGAPWST